MLRFLSPAMLPFDSWFGITLGVMSGLENWAETGSGIIVSSLKSLLPDSAPLLLWPSFSLSSELCAPVSPKELLSGLELDEQEVTLELGSHSSLCSLPLKVLGFVASSSIQKM